MYRTMSTFLFLTVVLGTMMVMTSEKWFIIWVGLEISTLALVPLLCASFSPRKMESAMKYFLIQAFSAALLLKSALIQAWLIGSWSILTPMKSISSISLTMALAFKLGLAPCHFWFPDVMQGLPFLQGLMVATWQKIAPLIILFSSEQLIYTNLMMLAGLISVLVGGWGGLNQTQVRKMLAFSSISNIGWMVVTSAYSLKGAVAMLIMYLVINTTIFFFSFFFKITTLGHLKVTAQLSSMSMLLIMSTMLSLGGLPPLTGFMIKFLSLYLLMSKGFMALSSILMLGSLLSLFFYLRVSFNASLMLFPHHIMSLMTWRKNYNTTPLNMKTWALSTLFIASTVTTPLTTLLYMII